MLKDGPKSSEELARLTSTHPPSLYRAIRALASVAFSPKTSRDALR
ncbi:MAG TPA: hypothetical protein VFX54_22560 [Candidatus Binatia bacterium]|nr:hypothetical protein [Candidatus Binatia bacterium]